MRISDWSSDVCSSDLHDAGHGFIGLAQHFVVVGVDGNIRVYIAVARMHVQRDEHPAFKYAVMDGLYFGQHSGAIGACEIALHQGDRKSTRLHSSHSCASRMPSSA